MIRILTDRRAGLRARPSRLTDADMLIPLGAATGLAAFAAWIVIAGHASAHLGQSRGALAWLAWIGLGGLEAAAFSQVIPWFLVALPLAGRVRRSTLVGILAALLVGRLVLMHLVPRWTSDQLYMPSRPSHAGWAMAETVALVAPPFLVAVAARRIRWPWPITLVFAALSILGQFGALAVLARLLSEGPSGPTRLLAAAIPMVGLAIIAFAAAARYDPDRIVEGRPVDPRSVS